MKCWTSAASWDSSGAVGGVDLVHGEQQPGPVLRQKAQQLGAQAPPVYLAFSHEPALFASFVLRGAEQGGLADTAGAGDDGQQPGCARTEPQPVFELVEHSLPADQLRGSGPAVGRKGLIKADIL